MKLHFSATSPFVRKVLVCAHEKGLIDRIELMKEAKVAATNPLSKVPALITDAGDAIFDSLVICDYLDNLDGGPCLIPADPTLRTPLLVRHAMADGIMEAGVNCVMESRRPEDKQWDTFLAGQRGKIVAALGVLERQAAGFGATVDLGTISVAVALGYMDFRLADLNWRDSHPHLAAWHDVFAQRPSMQATAPPS